MKASFFYGRLDRLRFYAFSVTYNIALFIVLFFYVEQHISGKSFLSSLSVGLVAVFYFYSMVRPDYVLFSYTLHRFFYDDNGVASYRPKFIFRVLFFLIAAFLLLMYIASDDQYPIINLYCLMLVIVFGYLTMNHDDGKF